MIHPTSIIHPRAEIDSSVEIGPWCTVGEFVKIAQGTRLISHVVVDGHTQIGEGNVFFPFGTIGAVPQDLKYKGEPTQLIIGDRNTIREGVTLNLGTAQGGGVTQIGNDNLIMAYTHMGHDCKIGNGCILANYAGLAGHVTLDDCVTLAGMCGISPFVRIGSYAYIGGQSGLERDVPPYTIVLGSRPSTIKGANIVGLKRRGMSSSVIQKINEAIKLWVRPDIPKEQCLLEIDSQYGDVPEIQNFIQFIRASETGVVR